MTIAVSAVVKPSKLLLRSVCISCLSVLCIAVAIGLGKVGGLPIQLRWTLFAGLVLSAMTAFFYVFLNRKTFHIDISGIGQIRFKEDIDIDGSSRQQEKQGKGSSTYVAELMNDSTIWPCLLLLRLRAEDQRTRTLVILPDCMDSQTFRALAVACRWIAAHNVHHAYTKEWGAKR
jgi:toxin CptA